MGAAEAKSATARTGGHNPRQHGALIWPEEGSPPFIDAESTRQSASGARSSTIHGGQGQPHPMPPPSCGPAAGGRAEPVRARCLGADPRSRPGAGEQTPALILDAILRERNRRHLSQPLYYTGKWWARRLAPITAWMVQFAVEGKPDALVVDPFAGSGTTLGEAIRLGHRAVGIEVNPYAAALAGEAFTPKHPDLESTVEEIAAGALADVSALHEPAHGAMPTGYFWGFRQRCPRCGHLTYLLNRPVIAQHAYRHRHPEGWVFCPFSEHVFPVRNVNASKATCTCGRVVPLHPPGKGVKFACWHCNAPVPAGGSSASPSPPQPRLIALDIRTSRSRAFYKPSQRQRALAQTDLGDTHLTPAPIPAGPSTQQVLRWGYSDWGHLYHPRQRGLLFAITRRVAAIDDVILQRQAALSLSGLLDYHSRLCAFKGMGTGAVRQAFASPMIHPVTISYETNPVSRPGASGDVRAWYRRHIKPGADALGQLELTRQTPVRTGRPADVVRRTADVAVVCADSATVRLHSGSIDAIVSDPPYFDRIFYDDLASPFTAWLRWCGLDVPPCARGIEAATAGEFSRALGAALRPSVGALRTDGRLVFTFHHQSPRAWIALAQSLETLPLAGETFFLVESEMIHSRDRARSALPVACDAILVFRKVDRARRRPSLPLALTNARDALANVTHPLAGDRPSAVAAAAVIELLASTGHHVDAASFVTEAVLGSAADPRAEDFVLGTENPRSGPGHG